MRLLLKTIIETILYNLIHINFQSRNRKGSCILSSFFVIERGLFMSVETELGIEFNKFNIKSGDKGG